MTTANSILRRPHIELTEVDVGVVYPGHALDLRRLVRVRRPDLEVEGEPAVAVEALVGGDHEAEVKKVIGI